MKKRFVSFFLLLLVIIPSFFLAPQQVNAATFRSDESLVIDERLSDLYAFGSTVTVDSPINNDLTTAGGTINLNDPVSGSLLIAGGTLNIDGRVGNTIRAAGGTIRISQPVGRDVLVAGGTIMIDETASISGDLVVNGGTVSIQSPVRGNLIVNGGQVTINATVGKNVEANVGELILGRQAVINGDLNYKSDQRATIRDGATIRGEEHFQRIDRNRSQHESRGKLAGILSTWSLYKLIVDILASLLLLYLLYSFTVRTIERSQTEPLKMGLLGLGTLFLGPILAFFLLILILPGILAFLLYGLLLLLAAFVSKLLVGRMILKWWYGRDKRVYILDWKAALVGPIVMFLLLFLPIIGWFIGFIFYLMALGGIVSELFSHFSSPGDTHVRPARSTAVPTKTVARTTTRRKK